MSALAEQAVDVGAWLRAGRRVARALLVAAEGSAPLLPGATMFVAADGAIDGSLTGGCVESAVVQEAEAALCDGIPRERAYGISDDLAGAAGLTCGGTVHVFIHALAVPAATAAVLAALDAVATGRPAALATLLDGPRAGAVLALADGAIAGSLGSPALDRVVACDAAGLLERGVTAVREHRTDGAAATAAARVHVCAFPPAPELLAFGANDFSAALAALAARLGFRVTISDPRARFAAAARFARAATVHVGWPREAFVGRPLGPRDAVVVLTHDARVDVPALRAALATDVGYVGALGSRRATRERAARLRAAGASEREIARIHAPAGLDIGGRTPGETALSILAEIVATRSGRPAAPLRDTAGPIRPRDDAPA